MTKTTSSGVYQHHKSVLNESDVLFKNSLFQFFKHYNFPEQQPETPATTNLTNELLNENDF